MSGLTALCLLGPTGTGKTEAALALADAFNGSVVNFDSRQVYQGVGVTTAQPSPQEQARCPHHLYGFLPCGEAISAGIFAELAAPVIREVAAQGRMPILVGGTGLYLRALLEGIAPIPDIPQPIREKVLAEVDRLGPQILHERVRRIDPAYADKIHPNDRQRVARALEVHESTGRTFTDWHAATAKLVDIRCLKLGIRMGKPDLDARLARRITLMLEQGALEEVRDALDACRQRGLDERAPGLSGIGCAELAAHLLGRISLKEALALWLANTKAYAKRQMTWFKMDPEVRWFGPAQTGAMADSARGWLEALASSPGKG